MNNNIFVDNPIIVNVLSVDSFKTKFKKNIKQKIVWVNTEDALVSKLWNSRDYSQLKKKYGNIGSIQEFKKGGNEDDIGDIDFDDEELEFMLKDDTELDIIEPEAEAEQVVHGPYSVVNDVYILPEDKVSDFKKKIYIQTGIPPYRQHLFYEYKGKSFPLSYTISHEFNERIDIRQISKSTVFYEGLPVETSWYISKDYLQVTALDEFHLLDHIYYKHNKTEFYLVDLNDFIEPIKGNLELLLKRDMYSIELIYYSFIVKYWPQLTLSVFGDYIKNENTIQDRFPELSPNISRLKNTYKLETRLIGKKYMPELNPKKWDVPIYFSITHSIVTVSEQFVLPGSIVYLRNLFDMFDLNLVTNYIICNDDIEGRSVNLVKTFGDFTPAQHKIPNSVLININISEHGHIHLILRKKGSYKVVTSFREDRYFNFDMIYVQIDKYIGPVIEKINSFGKSITNQRLVQIKNDNSVFTDIKMNIFWNFNISKKKFEKVKNILQSYVDANIIIKAPTTSTSLDYYFIKGMHKYEMARYKLVNPVQNQYQYLTESAIRLKHDMLITRRKLLSITHRFSDIKIEVSGIKEQEYVTLYMYMLRLFESIPREKGEDSGKGVKKLKNLKERDPVLYEFKKIYNSDLVYSKLCQQQKQPIMHGEPGKNRTKFWNFTTGSPAYYECPSEKYPYINFITKTHPKNYCIPCCYKLPPSTNTKEKRGNVYSTCMEHKSYEDDKKSLVNSRYVMVYGKDISVGRLSKLPENTLEPLFYDTFSRTSCNTTGKERVRDKGYYLFGVPQHIKNVSYIGFLFSASHALGKDILDFVSLSLDKIKKCPGSWSTLLRGTITRYFNTFEKLEQELTEVFIGNKFSTFPSWNSLFMEITKRYWGVSVIHFYDKSTYGETSNITLSIPEYIRNADQFKSNKNHLFVIERDRTFYPIYTIYKDVFFKMGSVAVKLYTADSQIVGAVNNLAEFHFNEFQLYDYIDLYLIKKFIRNSKYNIDTLLINKANYCYGVLLKYIPDKKVVPFYEYNSKTSPNLRLNDETYESLVQMFKDQNKKSKNKSFYIPLKESYHKPGNTAIAFEYIGKESLAEWKILQGFVRDLNKFITEYSKFKMKDTFHKNRLIYPLITFDHWLLLNDKVIGFRALSMYFMCKSVSKQAAQAVNKTKYIKLLYDPLDINNLLSKAVKPIEDVRSKLINKSLYNHYLYPILILELINVLDKQRNVPIRNKLRQIVNNISAIDMQNNELQTLLEKFNDDFAVIKRILNSITFTKSKKTHVFMTKKQFTKNDAQELINKSIFGFDRKLLDSFKSMSYKTLIKELKSIFDKLTVNKDPKINDEFPNMIMSCEINHPYCQNKKLMIKKKVLHSYLEIMAADILNPFKNKYIFSPIFVKNTINKFDFIVRDNEFITITM